MSAIKKVVLAYSGGLDTSVIVRWLQETYQCEVVTFTADIGQGEEARTGPRQGPAAGREGDPHRGPARGTFARDYVFPMFRANAIYEGEYLLGTSIARPLIAKRLVEIAEETGADAISHGATGKGNDQVRFELGAYALMPGVRVIAPWREWTSPRAKRCSPIARQHGIPVEMKRGKKSPYSMDANLLHISYEGGGSRIPWGSRRRTCGAGRWRRRLAPDQPSTSSSVSAAVTWSASMASP
jgi:argininosuccinate synthase